MVNVKQESNDCWRVISYKTIIDNSMFRQRFPQCSCQLFSPQTLHPSQFRSPPAHSSRPQLRSKKSLKSQSNSRHKNLADQNKLANKFDQISEKKLLLQQFGRYSTRAPSSIADHIKNTVTTTTFKSRKADNLFRISKENQALDIRMLQSHDRMSSPLQLRNDNILRPYAFPNQYINKQPFNLRPVDSSPIINKISNDNVRSAATTLAGSIAPSIQEGLCSGQNIYYNNRQRWVLQQQIEKINPQIYKQDFIERGVVSNITHLSRLSEMMKKEECESIYDGDKSLDKEQSRVLLSYKKLVEEKKGVLESSDHRRLFNFYREPNQNNSKSGIFQKLTLIAPGSR